MIEQSTLPIHVPDTVRDTLVALLDSTDAESRRLLGELNERRGQVARLETDYEHAQKSREAALRLLSLRYPGVVSPEAIVDSRESGGAL